MARDFRFVHIGIAAILAAAAATAIGVVHEVGAAGPGTASAFVPIVPCRLADTRPPTDNVGTRNTPIGPGEAATFAVWGTNGNCIIPNTATGIATNVTAVAPTASSYLTVYPSDASPRPTASNLNYTPTSPPTPNQVTVALSATGAISTYNLAGTVHIIIDIVGYYVPSTSGPAGPPGATGATGPAGPTCPLAGCTIVYTGQSSAVAGTVAAPLASANGCRTMPINARVVINLALPVGAKITAVTIRYRDLNSVTAFDRQDFGLYVVTDPGLDEDAASDVVFTQNNQSSVNLDLDGTPTVGPNSAPYIEAVSEGNANNGQLFCGAVVTYTF